MQGKCIIKCVRKTRREEENERPKASFFRYFFTAEAVLKNVYIYMQKETEKWKKIAQMRLNLSHAAF